MMPSLVPPPPMHVDEQDQVSVEYFDPEEDLPARRLLAAARKLKRGVQKFSDTAEKNRRELLADRIALTLD